MYEHCFTCACMCVMLEHYERSPATGIGRLGQEHKSRHSQGVYPRPLPPSGDHVRITPIVLAIVKTNILEYREPAKFRNPWPQVVLSLSKLTVTAC